MARLNNPTEPSARCRGFAPTLRRAMPFLLPSIIVLILIIAFPIGYNINLTFRTYNLLIPKDAYQWIGWDNYKALLGDKQFSGALIKTAMFTFFAVSIEVILGVAIAQLFNSLVFGRRIMTSMLLIPTILTPVVIGLIFNFMLNAQFGLLTYLFHLLGWNFKDGLLNQSSTAFAALIGVDVWEWTPFIALIALAGLQALPNEPMEAARIDGASELQLFWYVKLALIRPVLSVAVLFRAAEAIREFDKVFILTGGGPGFATELADVYLYATSFKRWELSYGATLGMAMFLLALLISMIYFWLTMRHEGQ